MLLHDGLYRRQELLETILKLLDEILNKFKVHTENKRLNSNLTSQVSHLVEDKGKHFCLKHNSSFVSDATNWGASVSSDA